jgi:hypothetical protein
MPSLVSLLLTWVVVKGIDALLAMQGTPSPQAHVPPPRVPPRGRRPTHPAGTSAATPAAPPTTVPATFTPPWPQVTPSGLPPFPGSGWVPDQPPPAAVVSRAFQLLPSLWSGGPGTFKVENTAGRWIAYRATPMAGGKRGVVAYRESQHATFLTPPPEAPATRPVVTPAGPVTTASHRPAPSNPQASAAAPTSTSLPTLRRGSKGPDVVILQRELSIAADGDFGPATERAVRAYQSAHGLSADGVVGPQTWGSLLGKAA